MRRYASKRSYVWSANIAYSVGLIASDGCLQKDGRHIDLTSTDTEQLTNFSLALGRDFYIGEKSSGGGRTAYRIQFGDVAYYDFLLQVGLTPAKSKTIGALDIPDAYYADFLRGLFDGDGSVHGYMDPRWRSSFMFYVSFASASLCFIDFLRMSNSRLVGNLGQGSVRNSTRSLSLAYAKAESHRLFSYMYYDTNCISLKRKRDKLSAFVQKDLADIIARQ